MNLTRTSVMMYKLGVIHCDSWPGPLHDHVNDVMQQRVAGSTRNGLQNCEI